MRHVERAVGGSLEDIGLSRADIEQEISKPFWRA
jgi:hypothetical protein